MCSHGPHVAVLGNRRQGNLQETLPSAGDTADPVVEIPLDNPTAGSSRKGRTKIMSRAPRWPGGGNIGPPAQTTLVEPSREEGAAGERRCSFSTQFRWDKAG